MDDGAFSLNTTFTNVELAQCARREAHMRRIVYADRVMYRRMKEEDAEREIMMMEAIAAHFEHLATTEAAECGLFRGKA